MKKLFYALTAATVVGTSVVPVGVFANNQINNLVETQEVGIHYQLNSFRNFILFYNSLSKTNNEMQEMEKNAEVNKEIDSATEKFYQEFFDNKEGKLELLKMSPAEEIVLQTFSNTYTNNTEREQIFKTQEYSKTIINTHSFSVSASEKVSAKTSFKIPFIGGTKMEIDLSSEQEWSNSTTTEEKLVNPSQDFVVGAYSVGKAEYIIRQGTYFNEGVIRVSAPLNLNNIEFPLFVKTNGIWEKDDDLKWNILITAVLNVEYEKEVSMNSTDYSLISIALNERGGLDKLYLNLPITWTSQGGKLDVNFSETPL